MPVNFTKLPFTEAQNFLREKVSLPTKTWKDIQDGMHARAFVIAGAQKAELLSDIRGSLQKALDDGTTLADFRKDFRSIVQRHGWSYKGKEGWRTAVIFNTNMRSAFSAGNEAQLQKTKASRPYARYIAGLSAEPRPEHLEWHNTILPIDHAWWSTHTPPNGWGCKCRKVSVSNFELEKNGWKVAKEPPTSPTSTSGIDESFNFNPGRAAWGQDTARRAAEREIDWIDLEPKGPTDFDRAEKIPDAETETKIAEREKGNDDDKIRKILRDSIGGDAAEFDDPTGQTVRVTQGLVDHMLADPKRLNGREQYFPFIPELIEKPYEVWGNFEVNKKSGRVRMRKRYVKGIDIGKKRSVVLVADQVGGLWTGLTIFRGRLSGLANVRKGRLMYGE